jgi:hypothetical protein
MESAAAFDQATTSTTCRRHRFSPQVWQVDAGVPKVTPRGQDGLLAWRIDGRLGNHKGLVQA